VTCGKGQKKRFRRCKLPECPSGGVEIESAPCAENECPDVNPYSWSAYTPCSATCGVGKSVRYRMCMKAPCPDDGYETEQINCYKPNCPVCVLDFEVVENSMVVDQSGYSNNGYLDRHVVIREHPQICGHYADLVNLGEIIFSAQTFLGKPRSGITIACWINIQGDLGGKHSVFSTVRQIAVNNYIGGYHFEIDDGKVRWFHRDENDATVFTMTTNTVALSRVWMHFAVTYDAYKGVALVFVDGKERGRAAGSGILSGHWGYKASIGYYDFDDRRLNGWIDEFTMYDFALSEEQIFNLLGKMRCPTGNTTTIEIDAFKFENVNVKRSVNDKDEDELFLKQRTLSLKRRKRHRKKQIIKNIEKMKNNTTIKNNTKLEVSNFTTLVNNSVENNVKNNLQEKSMHRRSVHDSKSLKRKKPHR